jgi:tetratricopeptide (TPR) repeat protein
MTKKQSKFAPKYTVPRVARQQKRVTAKSSEAASLLAQALAFHRAHRLAEAEQLYQRILQLQPRHFDSLHLVGIIHYQRGQYMEAVRQLDLALKINPSAAAAHNNRGNALRQLNRFDEALASCDKAIALKPDYAEAFNNRGNALNGLKRFGEALASYDKAIALKSDYVEAFHNRANVLNGLRRFDEALASYDKAIALKPGYAEAFSNRGNALNALKRSDDALASYDNAIALKPDSAEAFNNRGVVLKELKRFDEALASYDKAIALKPDYAEAFNNRGNALSELKRFDEALASYDKAIALNPDYADAFNNRGNAFNGLKRFDEAVASYDKAIVFKLDSAEPFHNLGVALNALKRFDEALASYDKAIALKPDYAEAFNNRGNALRALKRFDEALASYDKAIALKSDNPEAFINRGNALNALNRFDEALASYDSAIALKPDSAEAFHNRGNALLQLKRFDDAVRSYDKAIGLKPDFADAFGDRGVALGQLNRFDEALASYDTAIALKPDYAGAKWNRALIRLLNGMYNEGWEDYKSRFDVDGLPYKRPHVNAVIWRGEEITEQHLLVFCEQGLGDVIQFVRYLPRLVRRKAKVTFLAPAKLIRLLRPLTEQINAVSAIQSNDSFDFQCALMDLPLCFHTSLSSIPNETPYLRAEEDLVGRWKERIGGDGFKIGIAWQGNPQGTVDQGRSIPLEEYVPLSRLPGARLISLQKLHGLDQLARLPAGAKIESLGDDFDAGPDAFVDTAAVMENLDLIITSDTSIAHLAGALGRPTWIALKYVPDWRWLLDRDDSPWYPTVRLFRQAERGNWNSVFAKIERELRSLLGQEAAPV